MKGYPIDNPPYSDKAGQADNLEQTNGRVPMKVTSHCLGNSGPMENERDVGNYSGKRKE